VESKTVEFIEAESRMIAIRAWGYRRKQKILVTGYKVLVRYNKFLRSISYMVIIVNNIVLNTTKLLGVNFKYSYYKK
jgi:hypothetical protein